MGKVFISYSHDSPAHSARVLELSNRLRALGIDAELDRYHVRPPRGWPHWCEEQLRPEVSSFVLVVCTPSYRARVEGRVGADEGRGVHWEGAILYNDLYNAKGNSRFIPVLIDDAAEESVPPPLDGHTRYRIREFELADPGFAALYRELTGQPGTARPDLGEVVKLGADGPPRVANPLPEKPDVTDFSPGQAPDADALSFRNFWSPFSSEETVEGGEVRFWAIVETVAAMAVFWWVAIRFETFALLTSSLFVAPLLLLRSEESTRLGVKWFDEGMFPPRWLADSAVEAEQRWERNWAWIGAATGIAVSFGLGCPAAKFFLVGHVGWDAIGRGLGFELAAMGFAGAVAEAEEAAVGGIRRSAAAAVAAEAVAAPAAAAAAVMAGAGALAAEVAAAAAVPAAIAVLIAVTISSLEAVAGAVGVAIIAFTLLPGLFLGIWLSTLILRMIATARHAPEGYRRLPANVRRLALYIAPLQQPELLPGLPADSEFRFTVFIARQRSDLSSSRPEGRTFAYLTLAFAPFIYLPAWAYRFILKSTLWFWWILLIVGGAPKLDGGIEGLRADAYRKASAWIGIATTLFAFIGFGFGWLLKPWADNLATQAPLPGAVALLVLVDWKSVPVVQWVTLASALTTVAVVIWTRDLYVDWQNPLRAARAKAQLPRLGHLVKWKTGFGVVGIALLMLYFALYANAVHAYFPITDWEAGWLRWLYGTAAERLWPGTQG